jgi:integrase
VTLIWNQVACDLKLGLNPVAIASFRRPTKRIAWSLLTDSFGRDVEDYLYWAGRSDPFTPEARSQALAPKTLRLRRDQIHAAVSALVETGIKSSTILSLGDLVTPVNFKRILQRRLEMAGSEENSFNKGLSITLVLVAREWVKVEGAVLAELKRLASKLPGPMMGLTRKNKAFLRQFDDPRALIRLVQLPARLWSEVKRDDRPTFHTLAKAQTALAIAILTYMPVRMQNLARLAFDTHLFVRTGAGAISTLELSSAEVKNQRELAFDIPPEIAKMLIEYRERIAPKIIGHRPTSLFVNSYGRPKGDRAIAYLISTYAKKRVGIVLTPHQFRHLSAKVMLDAQPGAFESVRQLLGHKRSATTVNAYAGIDSRRAAHHHRRLIDNALAPLSPLRSSQRSHQR